MTRKSLPKMIAALPIALFLLAATAAHAVDVTVAWDPNPVGENVTGYIVYCDTASRGGADGYDIEIDVGNVTQGTVTLPTTGTTYYFAVRAYDGAGLTSDYSTELVAHEVVASSAGNGTIDPAGTSIVVNGANVTYQLTADAGYEVESLEVDGAGVGAVSSYTLANVVEGHALVARFAVAGTVTTYTVAASAGDNGTVSPEGSVSVAQGNSVTFTMNPDLGYDVADVLVDGVSVGAVTSYTFSAVAADHTLSASFLAADVLDVDADQLPDAWEIEYFGTTNVGPLDDPDGDFVTNIDEYLNGTDPTVADLDGSLTPAVWEPVSGGTVANRYPVLSVYNPVHAADRTVTYSFQIATDPAMNNLVLALDDLPEGDLVTAWPLTSGLTDRTRYYWRVRATDGVLPSPWMPVCTFYVDTAAPETTTVVDVFELVLALDGIQVDGVGSVDGVSVELPPNALPYDFTLMVGSVDNPPAAAPGMRILGKVYEFGPHGIPFLQSATVLLPYTADHLSEAGLADPSALGIFTYNTATLTWEPVPVEAVDYAGQRLMCKVDHFSMYAVGAADSAIPTTPAVPTASSGGGGGGGCFIQTLR